MSDNESLSSDINQELELLSTLLNNITLQPIRLNNSEIQNTNNSEIKMTTTYAEIKNLASVIPEYNGDVNRLPNFIIQVDLFYEILQSTTVNALQTKYAFSLVLSKITDKAVNIINENTFNDWKDLKKYLSENFEDKLTKETILLKILNIKSTNKIHDTLIQFKNDFAKYKSKVHLLNYNTAQKTILINEIQELVVRHFITLLPIHVRGSFITNNPTTLEMCENLLTNDYNYALQTFKSPLLRSDNPQQSQKTLHNNIPPQKFPGQQFPSKPINVQQNSNKQNLPFAPRQNAYNAVRTRQQFKPQPMSGITKSTIPMSAQTIKQNYLQENIEDEPENFETHFQENQNLDENPDSENYSNDNNFLESIELPNQET